MTRFESDVEAVLRAVGWKPDRRTDPSAWLDLFELDGVHAHSAAIDFLREFGGLKVEIGGPGLSRAKEPFEFNPSLCEGEGGRFAEFSRQVGRSLFPIGEFDHGRFFLGIDQDSEIYLVETWIATFGAMPTAVEHLVLGVRPTLLE